MLHKVLMTLAGALAGAGLLSCAQQPKPLEVARGTVITGVTVVDTRTGALQPGANVVLDEGRIQAITTRPVRLSGGVRTVEGQGQYLVPGYLDMHTHALPTAAQPTQDLTVLLARGVTGIREASGSPQLLAQARQHNATVLSGQGTGPEVLMLPTGLFAGQAPTEPRARQFVRERLAEGSNYVKLVGGPPPAFLAAIDEARKQGSHAAGHTILPVSALTTSNAGLRSFEHLGAGMGLVLDCSREESAIRSAALATPVPPPSQVINPRIFDGKAHAPFYQRIVDSFDPARCQTLSEAFVRNGSWQTVTLIRLRTQAFGADPAYLHDPNLKYVDKTRVALWSTIAAQYAAAVPPPAQQTLQSFYALQRRTVGLMQQHGVKILAGSDLGGGWVVPGFSLHQEFAELAAAGLTPLQVLQATTLHGAQFTGRESTMGSVEPGKNADLVLLEANPLTDVAHLGRISAVFLRGRHFPAAELDKMLADVAARYAAEPARQVSLRADPNHPPHN